MSRGPSNEVAGMLWRSKKKPREFLSSAIGMRRARGSPVCGAVPSRGGSGKDVVVAGGVDRGWTDEVEIFNTATKRWRRGAR